MAKNEKITENIVRKKLEGVGITFENGFLVEEQETINTDCDLEYIGSLVAEGFMSGYSPYWKLCFVDVYHDRLSDATIQHISKSVASGYVAGEVIENSQNQSDRGWWSLQT